MKKLILLILLIAIVASGAILIHKLFGNAGDRSYTTTIETSPVTQDYTAQSETIAQKKAKISQDVTIPLLNADRLFTHIKALDKQRYTDAERAQTRQYISQVLKTNGWSPVLQSFDNGVNVIAKRSGTDPNAGTILVGAHYDTVKGSPGADDNGSGVATVLEVARLLGKIKTPRSLQVAFFDGEELGLKGSIAFNTNKANLTDIKGAIILDMIGYACYKPGCQQYPEGLPIAPPTNKGNFLTVAGDLEHLPLIDAFDLKKFSGKPDVVKLSIPFKGLAIPDLLRSDHAPFWYQGIGAVIVTDTGNFRTPHYHQPSDKIANLDRSFFVGSANIVINVTANLLESQGSLEK